MTKVSDLELVKQLEKEIGIELKQVPLDEIGTGPMTAFAVDDNGHVKGLSIHKVNLTGVPALLSKFQRLEKLVLVETQLSDILCLKELKGLAFLDLTNNQISDISSLKELKGLTKLYLWENQIGDISSLKELKGLTALSLESNQIRDISSLKELKNLKRLYLENNEISQLPAELLDLGLEIKWEYDPKSDGIYLEGNPLESPPVEIVKHGTEAVRQYFKSLEGEKRALNEVKVLLVGDGAAGKTSLVKRLLGKAFDKNESQTHGININPWYVMDDNTYIKVRLWDFGGQEIMHATHQFFLSKRSLYILVLDGRKDEKTEYWLNHIKSFGGDSPVMVVLNKIDQNPGFDLNRRFLMKKYPNIKDFYRLSCANDTGIDHFKKELTKELAAIELIRTTWATSWFKVKKHLEDMEENFINYDTYQEICTDAGIKGEKEQDTLVDFLNDLGVILHFKEFHLEDTHVLEPKWVTNAVYKIINSDILSSAKGVLELRRLGEILKAKKGEKTTYTYPPDKYKYIFQLMKKFELCFPIDENKILVPDLLEVGEPVFDFDYARALKFRICYDFLPKSVMPRFMVWSHKDIKDKLSWRTGVVLENKAFAAAAVVKADQREKTINIFVAGAQKRDYFAHLLHTFREINSSFEQIEGKECVPLPDNPAISVSYNHLLWLEQQKIENYAVEDAQKLYDVRHLLGVVDKTVYNQLLTGVKKIFLSLEKKEPQQRGYDLEKFLEQLFELFHLAPRGSFRNTGEQIDGSFQLGNDTFLLEAKWKKAPIPGTDLVLFNDKVNSKPKWTRGLFVSISGFTGEAVKWFKTGRTTSIIGMDRGDLELVLNGHISLEEVIRLKLRHAGETNECYAPLEKLISLYHSAPVKSV